MKRFFKTAVCIMVIISVMTFSLAINASAASTIISLSSKQVKPGDNVTVTVKLNAGEPIYGLSCTVNYDTSVLKYVSGAHSASGSTLKIVDSPSGETSISYNLVFTALAEGSGNISASIRYSGASLTETDGGSAGAAVTVKTPTANTSSSNKNTSSKNTTPTITNNANLSSLTVEGGVLSPAFSKNTTDYTVTVENSVSSVTIKAGTADRNAKVSGTGAVELQVGENPHTVTVTASDGKTQKTYNINIKRASVEETLALNPLATVIDGKMSHIIADISQSPVPTGFTAATATYNGNEIGVFKSDTADYTLFLISRDEDAYVDYYIYKEMRDEFVPLQYMLVANNMFIFAELPEEYIIPEGYYETAVILGNTTVQAFCSNDERLSDFYTVYCYANGEEQFFRYDMSQSTIQRAPDFTLTPDESELIPTGIKGLIYKFGLLDNTTKILCYVLAGALIVIISLTISLIIVVKRRPKAHNAVGIIDDSDMADFFNMVNAEPETADTAENE